MKFHRSLIAAAVLGVGMFALGSAQASAIIYNNSDPAQATVALGVNTDGSLNLSAGNIAANAGATGLAFRFPDGSWRDATAPGCFCEGWGVSVNNNLSTSGSANRDDGTFGLSSSASGISTTGITTTSTLTGLPGLSVTQQYGVASTTSSLFQVKVTIKNDSGAAVNNVKYVRVMDWDVPNTEFAELVTIRGTGTTTLLERSHNNGFSRANPLQDDGPITLSGCPTDKVDFTDCGPADHGAYFRFNFGSLADGASYSFSIFYGAAGTERDALAAVGAAGIELYSFGQSRGNGATGSPATYIFGFSGVGGTPVEPNPVSAPGSLALAGLGLLGLGALSRRRKA